MPNENETGEVIAKRIFVVTMLGAVLYTAA